ncbi:MAG TPA: tetratricopeptide repeat protein [Longimicrobium sp.]|nr:tetratricopeptide repeat protein [Longimicrobium sp.]
MSELHRISGCENETRAADVVFIHGLGGDAFATWGEGVDRGNGWLAWLGEEFPGVGIWSLGYAASPTKWPRFLGLFSQRWRDAGYTMALLDRAVEVLELFAQRGVGERPLVLICHSLGGLLAKQVLRRSYDAHDPRLQQVARNTRAVLFLATPHAGSVLASLMNAFRVVFGATVSIEDLREHDPHLRDLSEWYRNHTPKLGIETATFYEQRAVRGLVQIVNQTSSHPGIGAAPVPLDEDHVSIAKPRSRDSLVYGAARGLIRHAQARAVTARTQTPSPGAAELPRELVIKVEPATLKDSSPPRVPHELPPAAEYFVGRQQEVRDLAQRLRDGRNTAVVGPGGMGKTALAAVAIRQVVGETPETLAASRYPDGVVFLDLYAFRGQAEAAWNALANKLAGAGFRERSTARERAEEACRGRRILVVIEGGEEADGEKGRSSIAVMLSVLSLENRRLLLTRDRNQQVPAESVELKEALHPDDAAELFDSLCGGRVPSSVRARVLELLEGHPLALTWTGHMLARGDDDPEHLVADWRTDGLPRLSDPLRAEHTLEWLFERSVRGLDDSARVALEAAGLLARAPFPVEAIEAAVVDGVSESSEKAHAALRSLVQRGLMRRINSGQWEFPHVLAYRFARKEVGSNPRVRGRLGGWMREFLKSALYPIDNQQVALLLSAAVEHTAALLRTDQGEGVLRPLEKLALYNASDRLESLGRLDLMNVTLDAVADWLERFSAAHPNNPVSLWEHSVLLTFRGGVLRDQGDLAGALATFYESLAVTQRLAASDPANAAWQRSLSVNQQRIGDVLRAQGNLAGALAAFRESLAVTQRLVASDPSNEDWQRDLSVHHNTVGAVLRARGDLAGALAAFRESLAVRQRLVAADPSNADRQRDLCVSNSNVGDVLRDRGDLAGALAAYRASLAITQRLATVDPSHAAWQRDLGVSQERLGDALRQLGDLAGALAAYRESLAVRQRLAAADPSNAGWQRDLCTSQERVGDVLRDQGDLMGALEAYSESLAVRQPLAAVDPSNAASQRELNVTYNKIGDVLHEKGDLPGALATYCESLAVIQQLATADPSNAGWQRDLSFTLTRLAALVSLQGEHDEALRFAEASLAIDERLSALDPTNAIWQEDVGVSRALVDRLRKARESSSG